MRSWRSYFPKWANEITKDPHGIIANLDTCAELIPIPETGDKYVDLGEWMREVKASGIVTFREYTLMRKFLAEWLV